MSHLRAPRGLAFLVLLLLLSNTSFGQEAKAKKAKKAAPKQGKQAVAKPLKLDGAEPHLYKQVGDVKLYLYLFKPEGWTANSKRPAIVFFFGGGWNGGTPNQFVDHARHLAKHGMVAAVADYRVRSRQGTTPFECVADGKSAVRWLRQNAAELGIDPERIAAGGGSAGGHVAAATAMLPKLDEPTEDASISSKPNALVLFNPVYDNGPNGYGYDRVKPRHEEISPMHNIRKGAPPAIVFLGTEDKLIPVATAKQFQKRMQDVGSRSELRLYEGQPHGFFNRSRSQKFYEQTVSEMDKFLSSLGYFAPQ